MAYDQNEKFSEARLKEAATIVSDQIRLLVRDATGQTIAEASPRIRADMIDTVRQFIGLLSVPIVLYSVGKGESAELRDARLTLRPGRDGKLTPAFSLKAETRSIFSNSR